MNELYRELIKLKELEPELVVTGSLSLYWHGMLNRVPTDLDVIVPVISNFYEEDSELLRNIQFFTEDQDLSKAIANSELLNYLRKQDEAKDRTEDSSSVLDVAFSCVSNGIKLDVFPLVKTEVEKLTKIITVDDVQHEFQYNDWPYIVPYKIKYFNGNSKHYADIQFIYNEILNRIEHAEDYGFGLVEGSIESKVFKQINEFLDKYAIDTNLKAMF